MSWAIMLQATDLCSKFGFSDGDIISNYRDDNNISLKGRYHKDVLVHLVKTHLEPKLDAGISLYEISSIHNPYAVKMIAGISAICVMRAHT